VTALRLGLMVGGDAPEQVLHRHVLQIEGVAAGFEPGQVEQVADDGLEPFGLIADDVEIVRGFRVAHEVAHREHLAIGTDRRQRCHELVRDVGEQQPSRPVGRLQLLVPGFEIDRHAVERAGERSELVTAVFDRARPEISGAEAARGSVEVVEPLAHWTENEERREPRADEQQRA